MTAYYNEVDPYAAAWLRNLIAASLIAPGDVDERSIEDVRPADLRGYVQCHFFAGIGVWSYALRRAGWPDDRPVWTGSCPCQPFSAAGKRGGTTDERHLWPHWFHLIQHGKPRDVPVFGEQVASKDGLAWLDLVHADLEGQGYAVGAVDLCAAGVGAPHIRQRLFFVADADGGDASAEGLQRGGLADDAHSGREERGARGSRHADQGDGPADGRVVGDPNNKGSQGRSLSGATGKRHRDGERAARTASVADEGVEHAESERRQRRQDDEYSGRRERTSGQRGPVNGFWANADWLPCIDGKARPVEPIAQQMADGSSESMGRLRPEAINEIEKEVADAFRCEADAREAMHDLRRTLSTEAPLVWSARRLSGVHEAPILLAFLRQLADQGWALAQGFSRAGQEATEAELRGVWRDLPTARAPQERGLAGQPAGEHSDAVRVLSSILARHAQAAWGETFRRHADDAFPLIVGAPARVGRLRAYGNAIVAPVAEEFIRAYLAVRAPAGVEPASAC